MDLTGFDLRAWVDNRRTSSLEASGLLEGGVFAVWSFTGLSMNPKKCQGESLIILFEKIRWQAIVLKSRKLKHRARFCTRDPSTSDPTLPQMLTSDSNVICEP